MNMPSRFMIGVFLIFVLTSLVSSVVIVYEAAYNLFPSRPTALAYQVNGLLDALKDAETGQRGYLITGKDEFLDPYREAMPRVQSLLTILRAPGHEKNPRVFVLTRLAGTKLDEMAEKIRQRREGVDVGDQDISAGKLIMDRVRAETSAIVICEEHRIVLLTAAQAAVSVLTVGVVVSALVVIALVAVAWAPSPWSSPPRRD